MARARRKRACFASLPQAATAVVRLRAPRKSRLLVRGRTWHVGARPCIESKWFFFGAVSFPMAWTGHNQRGTAGARRKCACYTYSPQAATAVTRLRALREFRLPIGGHGWHVRARSCIEGEGLFAGSVPFCMTWSDYNQGGMARVRRKRACCASSPQAATAVTRLRARSETQLLVRGRTWHVGARPCIESR